MLLREVCASRFSNVDVAVFDGLLVIDTRSGIRARVVARGLRAATDFEYELQIAHANADFRRRRLSTWSSCRRDGLRLHLRLPGA